MPCSGRIVERTWLSQRSSLQSVATRLALHQRLLRYLIDPYIVAASKRTLDRRNTARAIDPRTAGIVDVLLRQQARDIETVQVGVSVEASGR